MNKISLKITLSMLIMSLVLLLFGCQVAEAPLEEQPAAGVSADGAPGLPAEAQETAAQPEPTPEPESAETGADNLLTADATAEVVAETEGETHFVDLTEKGFEPDLLTINAGDKVVWQNVRTGHINRALVIGVRECSEIRSGFMYPGDSFTWTFDQPITCTIVDGIMTTVQSKIIVK